MTESLQRYQEVKNPVHTDEGQVPSRLGVLVRTTVEQTLNDLIREYQPQFLTSKYVALVCHC